ncbi:MAG: HAMP domain-containing histidine kinase, partial [Actinomycetota bacterium]|nr:HAMP domain-containing histidine kinase [Actinomycetota bacterium]
VAAFAAAFAAVGLAPMHVELRRHACTVVLVEAVLVAALFSLGPGGVVLAATCGEAVACCASRQQRLKLVFNVTCVAAASAVAAAMFGALAVAGPDHPSSWTAAGVAAASFAAVNLVAIASVLSLGERRRVTEVLGASAASAMAASGASASLGLAAVVLFAVNPFGPVLLVPLVAAVVVGTRRLALQSAERLRFQRLYEASARSGSLDGFEGALATVATEARGLVTGSAAVCVARGGDGRWVGVVVDDDGPRPASDQAARIVGDLSSTLSTGAYDLARLPRAARSALPPGVRLLLTTPRPDARVDVVLAVVREIAADGHDGRRVDVLSAFAGHAALTVANALLYAEVEEALRHQVDVNRHKGEFLAAVSHELRTPLTSVLGAIGTLRRVGDRLDAARRDQLLGMALDQGARLNRLIEELLLVAAGERGGMVAAPTPVAVEPLVRSVLDDLAGRDEGRLSCDASTAGVAHTDGLKLRRLLTELAENALKYAPCGPVEIRAARTAGDLVVEVADLGPGVPREDRERVFERFVQLDQSATRRRGGTGIGLYLCRQLASHLGGSLVLDERPGGGCLAVLRVPHGGPAGAADAGAEQATSLAPAPAG